MATMIKGKACDAEQSITLMQARLAQIGIEIEVVSWRNPVPGVYSVHIRDKACHALFSNGKGSNEAACLASALGEFFERLSCHYFFADYYLGQDISASDYVHYPDERWFVIEDEQWPDDLLSPELIAYFDPDGTLDPSQLFDLNSGAGERGICALPFRDEQQNLIYIPVNILGNSFVSNGMAAGNTMDEAIVQALSEICERYVKQQVITQSICLPLIAEQTMIPFVTTYQAISAIRDAGYGLRVMDASLGGKWPVVAVALTVPSTGAVLTSFGAHPCFEVALERTVTELLQGRALGDIAALTPPTFDQEALMATENIEMHFIDSTGDVPYALFSACPDYPLSLWDMSGSIADTAQQLKDRITAAGYTIYLAQYTQLGVPVCRICIPGMSDIYPVEDLAWENNNEGAVLRSKLLSLPQLSPNVWRQLLVELDAGGYPEDLPVAGWLGLLADKDSLWSTLRLAELKLMLLLALQDPTANEALGRSLPLIHCPERRRHYYCVQALLTIRWDENHQYDHYITGLQQLYGEKTVDEAMAVVTAKAVFYGLSHSDLTLSQFTTHQKLLTAYHKIRAAERLSLPLNKINPPA